MGPNAAHNRTLTPNPNPDPDTDTELKLGLGTPPESADDPLGKAAKGVNPNAAEELLQEKATSSFSVDGIGSDDEDGNGGIGFFIQIAAVFRDVIFGKTDKGHQLAIKKAWP